MRKNKCTLIIDGNWLLISRFSVINGGFEKSSSDLVKEQSKKELQELMARSITVVLNRFPIIDNVILVTDGGSWRKQLPVPQSISNITYKGNRSQTTELDWHYIYGALTALAEKCKTVGMTVANHSSIEGDDWVWYWSRRLNSEGTSCIIWSSDNDLKQLVQTDLDTTAFTAWYNDKNGMWFNDGLKEEQYDDIMDYFMKPITVKPYVLEELQKCTRNISYVLADDIVMEKVVCGDAGDNIKSIAKTVSGKRTYKVSSKLWNEIKTELEIETLDDFFKNKHNIVQQICKQRKFDKCPIEDILEMFDYNVQLVWLNEKVIPETIVLYMNQCEYKVTDTNYIKSNYKVLCETNNDIESIFESI